MLNPAGPRPSIAEAVEHEIAAQDAARGDWPRLRGTKMPEFPYPDMNSALLEAFVHDAMRGIKAGEDVFLLLTHLAACSWFEGGVVGYDRGQREGREAIAD